MSVTVSVSGRHLDLTDAMRDYAQEKLLAAIEDRHKISRAEVILTQEKTRSKAEIIVHGKKLNVEAESESYDMYESIDKTVSKIERQINRYFDKKQDHHKTSHGAISAVVDADSDDEDDLDIE